MNPLPKHTLRPHVSKVNQTQAKQRIPHSGRHQENTSLQAYFFNTLSFQGCWMSNQVCYAQNLSSRKTFWTSAKQALENHALQFAMVSTWKLTVGSYAATSTVTCVRPLWNLDISCRVHFSLLFWIFELLQVVPIELPISSFVIVPAALWSSTSEFFVQASATIIINALLFSVRS